MRPKADLLFTEAAFFAKKTEKAIKKEKTFRLPFAILVQKGEGRSVRSIVVTSGKGGVGKTTLVALLGKELARQGKRVVVVDLDFGLNNLDMLFRAEHRVFYDLSDVIEGRCRLKQALLTDETQPNLLLLPSKKAYLSQAVTGQKIRAVMHQLKPYADFVLVDSPAGMDLGFHRAMQTADEAIVVVTPSPLAVRDADKVLAMMRSYGMQSARLVVNRVRGELVADGEMLPPESLSKLLKARLLGAVGEEECLLLSKKPSPTLKKAVKLLATSLISDKEKIYDATKAYRGFWGSIRRKIKRSV